jgi:hypothetical protein
MINCVFDDISRSYATGSFGKHPCHVTSVKWMDGDHLLLLWSAGTFWHLCSSEIGRVLQHVVCVFIVRLLASASSFLKIIVVNEKWHLDCICFSPLPFPTPRRKCTQTLIPVSQSMISLNFLTTYCYMFRNGLSGCVVGIFQGRFTVWHFYLIDWVMQWNHW